MTVMDPGARELARELSRLDRRMTDMERTDQLSNSSIEGGSIPAYDPQGNPTMVIGQQYDGTNGAVVVGGPIPPTPVKPTIETNVPGTLAVRWSGAFEGGAVAPMDFARVSVYMTAEGGYFDLSGPLASITSASGGTVQVNLPPSESYDFVLVAWSTAGKFSGFSARGNGAALSVPTVEDVEAIQQAVFDVEAYVAGVASDLQSQGEAIIGFTGALDGLAAYVGVTFRQATKPLQTDFSREFTNNDIWFDTDDGNHVYVWNAEVGDWVDAQDAVAVNAAADAAAGLLAAQAAAGTAAEAILAAGEANSAAAAADAAADLAQAAADLASTVAQSKTRVYRQDATPATPTGGFKVNDVWFKVDGTGRYWDGDSWELLGTETTTGAQAKATAAQSAAISAAAADAATKAATAISTAAADATSKANAAQTAAATDATNKAAQAVSSAKTYTDTSVTAVGQDVAAAAQAAANAMSAAQSAQAVADGAIRTYYQSTAPDYADVRVVNVLPNPGAEGSSLLRNRTNTTVGRSMTAKRTGAYSYSLTAASNGMISPTVPQATQATPTVPGATWSAIGYAAPSTTARALSAHVEWWRADGSYLSAASGTRVTEVAGSWTAAKVDGAVAPAGAAFVSVMWQVFDVVSGEVHYLDDIALTQTATAQSFSGSDAATSDFTYVWEGAPDGSRSIRYPTTVIGDMWYDADDDQAYRWTGTTWKVIEDSSIAVALAAAQGAQTTADGKITAYYVTSAPWPAGDTTHDADRGDLWYDTDDAYRAYFWSVDRTWQPVQGAAILAAQNAAISAAATDAATKASNAQAAAISAAAADATTKAGNAQTAAIGVANQRATVYRQTTMPTGGTYRQGDIWFDTDDDNRVYIHNGTTFALGGIETTTGAQAKATAAQSAAISAAATDATTKASNAQNAAISAAATDATTKAAQAKNDAIAAAATDASTKATAAQSAAISAAAADATTKAGNAQTAAIGVANQRATVYRQAAKPTGGTYRAGDVWFDSDDENRAYIHDGSDFVLAGIETTAGAQIKATAAQSAAISAAASDATTKAANAQSAAISAAATDASTKATQAQTTAISTAATDAATKASNAQSAAISAAATDATTKAANAQSAAISAAATDATTKANKAYTDAKAIADAAQATAASAAAGAENKALNGGAENGMGDWAIGSAGITSVTDKARTGLRSFRTTGGGTILQDAIPVQPGQTWRFETYYQSEGTVPANPSGGLRLQSLVAATQTWGPAVSTDFTGSQADWRLSTADYLVPDGVTHIRARVAFNYTGGGSTWFDDVRLVDVTQARALEVAAADARTRADAAASAALAASGLAASKGRVYFQADPPAITGAVVNLVDDPSPQTGYWAGSSTAVATTSYVTNAQGRPAVRATRLTTGAFAFYGGRSGVYVAPIPVAVGREVLTMVYTLFSSVDASIQSRVGYGTGTAQIASGDVTHDLVAGVPQTFRRTLTIPASGSHIGTQVYPKFQPTGGAAGDVFEVSDVLWYVDGSPDEPYFDGDTPDSATRAFGWSGVEHNSRSINAPIEAAVSLWIDSDDGNKPYRWDGQWKAVQDAGIAAAAQAAAQAKIDAIAAAATDASTKASNAQSAAISAAASDATTKAASAQSAAISAAATDAATKATNAQSAAITAAASDATTKAATAQSNAYTYADNKVSTLTATIFQTNAAAARGIKINPAGLTAYTDGTISGGPAAGTPMLVIDGATGSITMRGSLTSGSSVTGAIVTGGVVQTEATAARGLKITSAGLTAYNGSGVATLTVDASTGSVAMLGSLLSGSSVTGATVTGGTVTGSTVQTVATAARGVKITSTGLVAYNASGVATLTVDGTSGSVSMLGALTSGSTVTGATVTGGTIQSEATAARGVKITSGGLTAYNASGAATLTVDASTGSVAMLGSLLSGSTITGAAVTGGTVTGSTVQTDATAARGVKVTTGGLFAYNASGAATLTIDGPTGAITMLGSLTSGSSVTGATVTGGTVQSEATAARGVKITSTGLVAYNASGVATTSIDAATGNIALLGSIKAGSTISGTAIDTSVLTGGTVQTDAAAARGVKITTAGLTAYNASGVATMVVNASTGALTLTGPVTTGGSVDGATVTGGTVQTEATASRGIKITSAGLTAFNASGTATFSVTASTGAVAMLGSLLSGSTITGTAVTGGSVTGATLQTDATAARGVKITSTGLVAYNASGAATLTVDGSTGAVTMLGSLTSGSSVTGATVTGGVLQTESTTNRGIKITSGQMVAYDGVGTPTFSIDAATGAVALRGNLLVGSTLPLIGGGNGVANSGFESDFASYSFGDPAMGTWAIDTAVDRSGTRSARFTMLTTGGYSDVGHFYGLRQDVSLANDGPVMASVWARGTAGDKVSVRAVRSIGGTIRYSTAQDVSSVGTITTTNIWQRFAVYLPANSLGGETTGFHIRLGPGQNAVGSVLWLDEVQVEPGEVLTAYSPKADEILPSSITTPMLVATAIDGMTVTGATLQTVATAARGVKITTAGITGYDAAGATKFILNASTGALTLTGPVVSAADISGSTVTGGTVQTESTASRGIKITSTGMTAYNGAGAATFSVTASTGAVAMLGSLLSGSTITGTAVTGGTVTGSVVQTVITPNRGVMMTSSGFYAYNASGVTTLTIDSASGAISMLGSLTSGSSITGATVTGGTVQTETTATRGVKITSAGLTAYNASNVPTFTILASTGAVAMLGAIQSGSTIDGTAVTGGSVTGATLQTVATAARGVKITSTGLVAYNASGVATLTVDGTSGSVTMLGSLTSGSTVSGATVTGGTIQSEATTARGVKITSAGVTGYDGTGVARFTLNAATGVLTTSGPIVTAADISGSVVTGGTVQTEDIANAGIKITSAGLTAYNTAHTAATFTIVGATGAVTMLGSLTSGSSVTGATVTGGTVQTETTGNRGVKITSGGLVAYNAAGAAVATIDAATGQAVFVGGVMSGGAVTGATVQTTADVDRGVKITTSGLTAYNTNGGATFIADAATGAVTMTGALNAGSTVTGATVTGGTVQTSAEPLTGIKMTSAGLIAYGPNGATNLTIEGGTGNVLMRGTIQSGSNITGASVTVGNITINPTTGITVPQPGDGLIQFPADGTDAIIRAKVTTTALTTTGSTILQDQINLYGTQTLMNGVSDPTAAPSLAIDWPKVLMSSSGAIRLVDDTNVWWVFRNDASRSFRSSVNKTTGQRSAEVMMVNEPSLVSSGVKIGSYFYMLEYQANSYVFHIYRYNAADWSARTDITATQSNIMDTGYGLRGAALGVDSNGTDLVYATSVVRGPDNQSILTEADSTTATSLYSTRAGGASELTQVMNQRGGFVVLNNVSGTYNVARLSQRNRGNVTAWTETFGQSISPSNGINLTGRPWIAIDQWCGIVAGDGSFSLGGYTFAVDGVPQTIVLQEDLGNGFYRSWFNPQKSVVTTISLGMTINYAGNYSGNDVQNEAQVRIDRILIAANYRPVKIEYRSVTPAGVFGALSSIDTGAQQGDSGFDIMSVSVGNHDYGSLRRVFGTPSTPLVYNASNARQTGDEWAWPTGVTANGLIYSAGPNDAAGRFIVTDGAAVYTHSQLRAPATYFGRYSWADIDSAGGLHETLPSPPASLTVPKRAAVRVTTQPAPQASLTGADVANMVRVYLGASDSTTRLQPSQPARTVSAIVYDAVVTASGAVPPGSNNWGTLGATGRSRSQVLTAPVDSTVGGSGWQHIGDGSMQLGATTIDTAGSVTFGGAVPVGTMMMYAAAAAPNGWLLCQGQAVSRTTYARLFAAIGTTFGVGNNSTTFNLPDMRDRMPVGAGSAYAVNAKGGASTKTLSESEMPYHSHGLYDPGHVHGQQVTANPGGNFNGRADYDSDSVVAGYAQGLNTYGSGTGMSVYAAGGSANFSIMNPYVGLTFIIRAF